MLVDDIKMSRAYCASSELPGHERVPNRDRRVNDVPSRGTTLRTGEAAAVESEGEANVT